MLPNIEEAMEDARNGKLSPYWQNNLKRECLHGELSAEERLALSELNCILSETPQWSSEEELCHDMENIGGRVRFCRFWNGTFVYPDGAYVGGLLYRCRWFRWHFEGDAQLSVLRCQQNFGCRFQGEMGE